MGVKMSEKDWFSDRKMPHMISTRDSYVINATPKTSSRVSKYSSDIENMFYLALGLIWGISMSILVIG